MWNRADRVRRSPRAVPPTRRPSWRTGRSGQATNRTRSGRSGSQRRTSASCRRGRRTRPAGGSNRRYRNPATAGEVSGDCCSRTATRTTRDASRVERILRRAERRVLGGRTHRELVEVGLADHDRTRPPLAARPWRRRAVPILEDFRRARCGDARGAHVVLDRDRHTGERAGILSEATAASIAAAASRAASAVTRLKALISPSRASIRARCSSITSTAERSPDERRRRDQERSRLLPQDRRDTELTVLRGSL